MDTAEQFWARVKRGRTNACWLWQGACNNTGYGTVDWRKRTVVAHRVAAMLSGLVRTTLAPKNRLGSGFVLHTCDVRACCNPQHLYVGTYRRNLLDAYERKRKTPFRGETHTNAKLTTRQVASIRARYSFGKVRQVDLAAEYGVSQRVISLIVRGETYK